MFFIVTRQFHSHSITLVGSQNCIKIFPRGNLKNQEQQDCATSSFFYQDAEDIHPGSGRRCQGKTKVMK